MSDTPLHTSKYEWYTITYEYIREHTDNIRAHTSDVGMTYEYLPVTY